jgi:sulfur relay (sulfurtransferase) DsrF/TusC family protein
MNTLLNKTLTLLNTFNIQNSYSLAQSLINTKIDRNTKLCLFGIENMYTNIPTSELKNIIKTVLNNDHYMSKEEKEELLYKLNMILE